jgi:transposase InsO family protein
LCAVRDGCSRRVIGWAIDDYLHTDLVQAALEMAVAMRGELAGQVVLHADYAEVCVKPRIRGDRLKGWGVARGFLGLTLHAEVVSK